MANHTLTIAEVAELMGASVSTARKRLERAGIRGRPGRSSTRRLATLYPRADIEALIADGIRPPGRPKKD